MDKGIPQPIACSLYIIWGFRHPLSSTYAYCSTFNYRFPNLLGIGFALFWIMMKRGADLEPKKDHILDLRARSKITSHFNAPIHPAWLRCVSVK